MKAFLFLVALFVSNLAIGQEFIIKRLELAGDNINIYYDLVDTIATRSYTITLLSSHDNFISPLQKVKGDLGLEVVPGYNKRITWEAKEELGTEFNGTVNLEVRGRLYIPFVRLDGLNQTFRRLRPTEITWSGGTEQNILHFDLYKGDEKITSFTNIANVGHYTLTLPYSVRPGKDYRFRITDSKNKDQIVFSKHFKIVRRTPLIFKVAPVIIIGLASYLAFSGNKGTRNIPNPIEP